MKRKLVSICVLVLGVILMTALPATAWAEEPPPCPQVEFLASCDGFSFIEVGENTGEYRLMLTKEECLYSDIKGSISIEGSFSSGTEVSWEEVCLDSCNIEEFLQSGVTLLTGTVTYYSPDCDLPQVTDIYQEIEGCEPPTGACCQPDIGSCVVVSAEACEGVYQGDGTSCEDACPPPEPPTGACCLLDGSCQNGITQADCDAIEGAYNDGILCEDVECPQPPVEVDVCYDEFNRRRKAPKSLTFKFTGGNCAASNNSQDPRKATCSESGNLNNLAVVIEAGKIDNRSGQWKMFYDGSPFHVNLNETFTISKPKVENDSNFELTNSGGTQSLKAHTSCSQPLFIGDTFGGLALVDFIAGDLK